MLDNARPLQRKFSSAECKLVVTFSRDSVVPAKRFYTPIIRSHKTSSAPPIAVEPQPAKKIKTVPPKSMTPVSVTSNANSLLHAVPSPVVTSPGFSQPNPVTSPSAPSQNSMTSRFPTAQTSLPVAHPSGYTPKGRKKSLLDKIRSQGPPGWGGTVKPHPKQVFILL